MPPYDPENPRTAKALLRRKEASPEKLKIISNALEDAMHAELIDRGFTPPGALEKVFEHLKVTPHTAENGNTYYMLSIMSMRKKFITEHMEHIELKEADAAMPSAFIQGLETNAIGTFRRPAGDTNALDAPRSYVGTTVTDRFVANSLADLVTSFNNNLSDLNRLDVGALLGKGKS